MPSSGPDRPDDGDGAEQLGRRLRQLREAAGLSLAELARKVNYSRGYLSKVENGHAPGNAALAQRCDDAFGSGGTLASLVALSRPAREVRSAASPPATSAPLPLALANAIPFILALDAAHGQLRRIAESGSPPNTRLADANRAFDSAGLYPAREQLLVSAAHELVTAGETAFLALIAVRDVIRAGATLNSAEYHRVYHPFAESLWSLRMVLRSVLGAEPFSPEALTRIDWSDRERCASCEDV